MQERRYLAAALLGAGGGGGRWSERVKSAVQNRMKERARCERESGKNGCNNSVELCRRVFVVVVEERMESGA